MGSAATEELAAVSADFDFFLLELADSIAFVPSFKLSAKWNKINVQSVWYLKHNKTWRPECKLAQITLYNNITYNRCETFVE